MSAAAIDFVVPAYNAAQTLGDTLRSLQQQTSPAWRCIVVDDGSRDDPAAIVRAARDQRIAIVHQANRGLSGARNRGLAECRAPLVCFLDADDVVAPSFVHDMTRAIGTQSDAAACAYAMVGPALEDLDWTITPLPHELALPNLLDVNPLAVGGVVLRRASLARLNLLSSDARLFDESLPCSEDWDAWLRLARAGGTWAPIVQAPLFRYRITPGSMNTAIARMWRVGLDVIARAASPQSSGATRRWHIRHIARAVAVGDEPLARQCAQAAGPVDRDDLDLLVSTLRWSLCRAHAIGPASVNDDTARDWSARCTPILSRVLGAERAPSDLVQHFTAASLESAAAAVLDRLSQGRRVALFGMGRNARRLFAALSAAPTTRSPAGELVWMDDEPSATCPWPGLRRITSAELRPSDVILITPDRAAAAIARFAGRAHVHTLRTIAAQAPSHAA